MHIMQKTVQVFKFKGIDISPEEETALDIAIIPEIWPQYQATW